MRAIARELLDGDQSSIWKEIKQNATHGNVAKEAHDIAETVEEDIKKLFRENSIITIHIEPYI